MSPDAMSPESMEQISAHLFALEKTLLDPAVRRDRARVSSLLAEDFIEFGSSGKIWSRHTILDLLETENFVPPEIEDLACRRLGDGVMLVTYKTARFNTDTRVRSTTLRSSIWIDEAGNWLIHFHQGTRAD
jgi:hypothetical protein